MWKGSRWALLGVPLVLVVTMSADDGCTTGQRAESASGVQKASVTIRPGADGYTVEQRNIRDRLIEDNKPGAIKHLYVISAYSGQVIIYSTVRGKVTSGGKRLTPSTIIGNGHEGYTYGFRVPGLGDRETAEVLQDDGSYGTSDAYLYWWDTKGVYHQHYLSGGQILHISDQLLAVKSIIINMAAAQ